MRVIVGLVLGALFSLPSSDVADDAVRRAFRSGDYQRENPGQAPPGEASVPPLALPLRRGERSPQRTTEPAVAEDVAAALLWVLLIVAVILALVWVVRRLRLPASAPDPVEPEAAAPRPADLPLADAEALAADGHYAEAIHALLLHALRALHQRDPVAASLTSREIVASLPQEAEGRRALGGLVRAVEWSLFGGRDVDRVAYDACADRYRALRAALGGESA